MKSRTLIPVIGLLTVSLAFAGTTPGIKTIIENMETAYASVDDYQARIEVRNYRDSGSFATDRFVYTFRKPKSIRLDFESPHPGMILIYPDKNGEAVVQPFGFASFFRLHLSPGNALMRVSQGQQVHETDLGLLIRNIAGSLTDQSRGPVRVSVEDRHIRIQADALDHFRKDRITSYAFFIDMDLWLPVKVEESTLEGKQERTVTFKDLRINAGIPDRVFEPGKVDHIEYGLNSR